MHAVAPSRGGFPHATSSFFYNYLSYVASTNYTFSWWSFMQRTIRFDNVYVGCIQNNAHL